MVMQVCNHSLGTATSTMVQLPLDNVSNFAFDKDTLQNSVQFNSESLVTDFEFSNGI